VTSGATIENRAATHAGSTITIGGAGAADTLLANETVSVTIRGTTVTYTIVAGDIGGDGVADYAAAAAGLAAAINTQFGAGTASATAAVITLPTTVATAVAEAVADADVTITAATGDAIETDIVMTGATGAGIIRGAQTFTVEQSATASTGVAAINAEGIATFNSADDTLAERIIAVEAGITAGTESAGDFAIFELDGNSFVFIHDGTAGLAATDVLIRLTGVTGLSDSTISTTDLTIA
jgi:hypothetical protein